MVENEATITIVLPDFKGTDGELSDLELDQVAGGKGQVKEIFNVIWEVMQVSFDLMKYTINNFNKDLNFDFSIYKLGSLGDINDPMDS